MPVMLPGHGLPHHGGLSGAIALARQAGIS
jgi:hypothetical protein